MANRNPNDALFRDIRWVPDPEDPENRQIKTVIPPEKWPSFQRVVEMIRFLDDHGQNVLELAVSVHQDARGQNWLRLYSRGFGNGQFALAALRMRRVTRDGETLPKMNLSRWWEQAPERQASPTTTEASIDDLMREATTVSFEA